MSEIIHSIIEVSRDAIRFIDHPRLNCTPRAEAETEGSSAGRALRTAETLGVAAIFVEITDMTRKKTEID